MFPAELFAAYTLACVLLVLSPGPDNLLAIGRGLSQGWRAATISGLSSGAGILFHVAAATFGLTLLMQTSQLAFWAIKIIGAAYLLYLGVRVLMTRSLIRFEAAAAQPLSHIFTTGFLSAALNPKPGFFVLAFLPQFVSPARGDVTTQMLVYGGWFALLTAIGFALMGISATSLLRWLQRRARVVAGLNIAAGLAFIASGLSIAALRQK
ncbi:LysE family translocator [Chitinibacteraceae bacterium HSL-7]